MARGISDDQHYKDIGAAIRTKNETDTLYKPSEMASAILAIQGGGDLNFEVVGGETEPTNPKENTIWINTPTEITGWVFSAAEPSEPVDGMVFFATRSTGSTEFNALQENAVSVYPVSASQYIEDEGAWIAKTAMIYQKGTWSELTSGMLYKLGDEYTTLTGGWALSTTGTGTHGESLFKGTIRMYFSTTYASGSHFAAGFLRCNKKIDLTDVTTIYAEVSDVVIASGIEIALVVSETDSFRVDTIRNALARADLKGDSDIVKLDVSGISGSHWVGFAAEIGSTSTNGTSQFYVYKVSTAKNEVIS